MTAAYILDAIRTAVYDCETYNQFTDLNTVEQIVPEITKTYKKHNQT